MAPQPAALPAPGLLPPFPPPPSPAGTCYFKRGVPVWRCGPPGFREAAADWLFRAPPGSVARPPRALRPARAPSLRPERLQARVSGATAHAPDSSSGPGAAAAAAAAFAFGAEFNKRASERESAGWGGGKGRACPPSTLRSRARSHS